MGKVDFAICGAEAVCESGGLVNYVGCLPVRISIRRRSRLTLDDRREKIGGYQMAIAAKAMGKPLYGTDRYLRAPRFSLTAAFCFCFSNTRMKLVSPTQPLPNPSSSAELCKPQSSWPECFSSRSPTPEGSRIHGTLTPSAPSPLSQYDLPNSLPAPPLSFATSTTAASRPSATAVPPTPSRPMLDSPVPIPLAMTDEMTRSNPTLDYTPGDLVHLIVSDLGILTPAVCYVSSSQSSWDDCFAWQLTTPCASAVFRASRTLY